MLTELRVHNFAIIDDIRIQLCPGLNVLTGETGAGKSIIVLGGHTAPASSSRCLNIGVASRSNGAPHRHSLMAPISIIGPMAEIRLLTLITAFGIAVVKAYLVAKNFMHIDMTQRYVSYLVATCLVFMLLFFAGVAPDVMKAEGTQWRKPLWQQAAAAAQSGAPAEHGGAEAHH